MKHVIITSFTQLAARRRLLSLVIALVLLAIAAVIYIGITVQSSEVRVITQYTAYGQTHFFRSSWLYLLSFMGFAVMTAGFSIAIGLKMLRHGREPLAFLINWLGVATVIMSVIVYSRIINMG